MSRNTQGILFVAAGALLWGFSGTSAQAITQNYGMSPYFLSLIRMPISAAIYAVILLVAHRHTVRQMLADRETMRQLVIFGIFGLFMCQTTYVVCVSYTNAGTGTVLESLNIVVCMLWTCIAARSLPNRLEVAGLVCAMAAVYIISTGGNPATLAISLAGLLWGLGAAASQAFSVVYPRRLFDRWGTVPATGMGVCIAALLCLVLLAGVVALVTIDPAGHGDLVQMLAFPQLDAQGWLFFFGTTVVGTLIAFSLFLHGTYLVGATRGSQLGAIEPAMATVLSAVWLGTVFTWAHWLGLALIIATIMICSVARPQEDENQDVLEAAEPPKAS